MCVPLGFLKPRMSQELLQVVETAAVHHKMRRKCVPQIVKTVVVRQLCLFLGSLEVPVNVLLVERLAVRVAKHKFWMIAARFDFHERTFHNVAHRDSSLTISGLRSLGEPIAVTKSRDLNVARLEIHPVPAKTRKLTSPHAGVHGDHKEPIIRIIFVGCNNNSGCSLQM